MTEFFADFGLRDWLLVLGPIFIAGILIHGYWRMRTNRNSLKMALDKSFLSDGTGELDEGDELSMLRAELPSGGARVIVPEQGDLNLEVEPERDEGGEEAVPILVETVVEPDADSAEAEPVSESDAEPEPAPIISADRPEKYVVINVMAIGEPFDGQSLLENLVEMNLSLGEMNIFHREQGNQTLFSLMNAVEPGSFDLSTINDIQTPAVSMFMRVHELAKPTAVFDQMLEVAETLAQELGGEVRDESRSVMTTQTIEHCRQDLKEYEFKNPA